MVDKGERIFLLEVFVDNVHLENCKVGNKLVKTCVRFKFLNYPFLEIMEDEYCKMPDETCNIKFQSGKSCLFSLRKNPQGCKKPPLNLNVNVVRMDSETNAVDVGKTVINLSGSFTNLIQTANQKPDNSNPVSKIIKETYVLANEKGQTMSGLESKSFLFKAVSDIRGKNFEGSGDAGVVFESTLPQSQSQGQLSGMASGGQFCPMGPSSTARSPSPGAPYSVGSGMNVGMGPPGMGPPGMGSPGMGPPGMGPPGMGPAGMGPPGMMGQGFGPPGMMGQGMGPPGMMGQGMGPPGMMGQGMGPPGMMGQGMGPPGMMGQGMCPPGMMGPGMGPPGMMSPGMGVPGMMGPGMGPPGMMTPLEQAFGLSNMPGSSNLNADAIRPFGDLGLSPQEGGLDYKNFSATVNGHVLNIKVLRKPKKLRQPEAVFCQKLPAESSDSEESDAESKKKKNKRKQPSPPPCQPCCQPCCPPKKIPLCDCDIPIPPCLVCPPPPPPEPKKKKKKSKCPKDTGMYCRPDCPLGFPTPPGLIPPNYSAPSPLGSSQTANGEPQNFLLTMEPRVDYPCLVEPPKPTCITVRDTQYEANDFGADVKSKKSKKPSNSKKKGKKK